MNLVETQSVNWSKPAFDLPGMRRIRLDPHGDLLEFEAIPQRNTMEMPTEAPDWEDILRIAGYNPRAFSTAPPTWTPTQPFDVRTAWTGSCPNFQPDLRIEAASWKGDLVWFRVISKWEKPQATVASDSGALAVAIQIFFFVGLLAAAAALAWQPVDGWIVRAFTYAFWHPLRRIGVLHFERADAQPHDSGLQHLVLGFSDHSARDCRCRWRLVFPNHRSGQVVF